MGKFAQKVKRWYDAGIWTDEMVQDAYYKGKITQDELDVILKGGDADAPQGE